jgi:hypothetical protein
MRSEQLKVCIFKSWLVVSLGLMLTGCAPDVTRQWREEVVLSDGTPITTLRTATWDEENFLSFKSRWVKLSDTLQVEKSENLVAPGFFLEKGAGVFPFLLDRLPDGTWVIITYIWDCARWDAMGEPKSQHMEYWYVSGVWEKKSEISKMFYGRHGNIYKSEPYPSHSPDVANPVPLVKKENLKNLALEGSSGGKNIVYIDPTQKPRCSKYPR